MNRFSGRGAIRRQGFLQALTRRIMNFGLFLIGFCHTTGALNATSIEEVRSHLRDTTTLYWLGIADKGDPLVFARGLRSVEAAEALLRDAGDTIPAAEAVALAETLALLRADLTEQFGVARNNHAGRLPLTRFLGASPFLKAKAFGTYEVAVPPGELLAARASEVVGRIVQQGLWGDAQMPVFVFAGEGLGDAESALRVGLKNHYRLKVFEKPYLRTFLSADELAAVAGGAPTRALVDKIQKKLGVSFTAFAHVELYHRLDEIHFYKVTVRIFDQAGAGPAQTILHYEFVRDKRGVWWWGLLLALVLAGTAVGIFHWFNGRSPGHQMPVATRVGVPVAAWFAGLAVAKTVAAVLGKAKPDYQDYIAYSFWWLPLLFLLLFVVTAMVVRKGLSYLPDPASYLGPRKSATALYVAAGLGVATLLGFGLLLYHGPTGWPLIAAAAYLYGVSGFVFGKAVSPVDPRPLSSIAPFVLLIAVGAWVIGGTAILPAWGLLALTAGAHALYLRDCRHGLGAIKAREESVAEDMADAGDVLPEEVFRERVEAPPYFETAAFARVLAGAAPFLRGESTTLCLVGEAGVGKTAAAEALIRRLRSESGGGDALYVLRGVAGEQEGDSRPFLPVRRALGDFFEVSPLDSVETQAKKVDSVLDGVFKKFVPYAGLLFPASAKGHGGASTGEELFHSIAITFKRLAERRKTVFFLDDLHWADAATFDLLRYLQAFFHEHPHYPVLFLYTTRPHAAAEELAGDVARVPLSPFSGKETRAFLREMFAVDTDDAQVILDWLKDHRGERGHLFWLLRVLRLLLEGGHLRREGRRYRLTKSIRASGRLPIPEEYRLAIREELEKLAAHRNLIGMAAVIGLRFEATAIADGLKKEPLRCLEALEAIENTSGLIFDVPEQDGVFAFRSSFALETVRAELGIDEIAAHRSRLKEIVKEYHALVARVTEEGKTADGFLKAAASYHTAGPRYSGKTFALCLKAADHCMDLFRFAEARRFLGMAEEALALAGGAPERVLAFTLAKMRLTVEEGRTVEVTPEAVSALLEQAGDLDSATLARFALYFYHLRRFDDGMAVAERILGEADDALGRARGYFWRALCRPPAEPAPVVADLREALDSLQSMPDTDETRLRLEAKVHNAMGEAYSRMATGDAEKRECAKTGFLKSIEIKSRPEIFDRAGLARSYGGLGRLALLVEPSDPQEALGFFQKDLELAEITGDHRGQVKMYSFIGECHRRLGQVTEAITVFQRSRERSTDPLDTFFALLGLLKVGARGDSGFAVGPVARELADLMDKVALPPFCKDELKSVLGEFFMGTVPPELRRWV